MSRTRKQFLKFKIPQSRFKNILHFMLCMYSQRRNVFPFCWVKLFDFHAQTLNLNNISRTNRMKNYENYCKRANKMVWPKTYTVIKCWNLNIQRLNQLINARICSLMTEQFVNSQDSWQFSFVCLFIFGVLPYIHTNRNMLPKIAILSNKV